MGVYIKDMEMPIDKAVAVVIHPDGTAYTAEMFAGVCTEYLSDCTAVSVPAHGRLGDLDALKVKAIERSEKCGVCVNVLDKVITAYDIETAPTIIPADPAEEGE